MSGQIKKIRIKNIAVFQDFNWDVSIRDAGNNIAEFKKINIFYGRNYSGKTTLSRIIRTMETKNLPVNYENPEFSFVLEDNQTITQDSFATYGQTVRVFNKDFVKDNLRFLFDEDHNISSFATGYNNNKITEEIKNFEAELGLDSEDNATGLYGKLKEATNAADTACKSYNDVCTNLESKLTSKANDHKGGIKHNKIFGDANYNITRLKRDIANVTQSSSLDNAKIEEYNQLLKEEPKQNITESIAFNLNFESYSQKTKELIETKISVSEPIQELLSDAALQSWVRNGRAYHESKRTTCAFCGGEIPKDLWSKLDKHFNKESEQLISEIDQLLQKITVENSHIDKFITMKNSDFYSKFHNELNLLNDAFNTGVENYHRSLTELTNQLKRRKDDIFNPVIFEEPKNFTETLNNIRIQYENLRNESNNLTVSLSTQQDKAKEALRLHEVYKFAVDIKYLDECENIEQLKKKHEEAKTSQEIIQNNLNTKKQNIDRLKFQLKDEGKAAEKINELLRDFFGHKSLLLKPVKKSENDQENKDYHFEVIRKDKNDKKAYNLSEGECSLIAFCYFIAKLEDVETSGMQPIVWIDDPVSSLDSNHIFFIYSLIRSKIVEPDQFKQLFISTHNLDFLKYIKRLPGSLNEKKSEYFIIIPQNDKTSDIKLMPDYLKKYVTEFNYLFHQIYKCAKDKTISDDNYGCYYNFGNNARKFLEMFLYYKYPDAKDNKDNHRMLQFFKDDHNSSLLIDRYNNEHSHLEALFEKGHVPMDNSVIKKIAERILKKIKENDKDQYNALLQSIGEEPEQTQSGNAS